MPTATSTTRSLVTRAKLRAAAALFVCTDCPLGRRRRREFKRIVKQEGRKREVRIVRSGCLDLCPKHGTAMVLARQNGAARAAIADDRADAQDALARLLDESVSNPVTD